jgi:hypothetical protein
LVDLTNCWSTTIETIPIISIAIIRELRIHLILGQAVFFDSFVNQVPLSNTVRVL